MFVALLILFTSDFGRRGMVTFCLRYGVEKTVLIWKKTYEFSILIFLKNERFQIIFQRIPSTVSLGSNSARNRLSFKVSIFEAFGSSLYSEEDVYNVLT